MVFLEPCYFLYIHPDAGSSVTRYRPGKFAMMQKLYRETAAFAHDMGCPEDSRRQARFLFVKWTWSCYFDLYHPSCPLRAKARTLAIQETLETEELQYCAANCRLQGRMDQILAGAIVKKRILRIKLLARGIRFVKIRLGGLYSRIQNKRTNAWKNSLPPKVRREAVWIMRNHGMVPSTLWLFLQEHPHIVAEIAAAILIISTSTPMPNKPPVNRYRIPVPTLPT